MIRALENIAHYLVKRSVPRKGIACATGNNRIKGTKCHEVFFVLDDFNERIQHVSRNGNEFRSRLKSPLVEQHLYGFFVQIDT